MTKEDIIRIIRNDKWMMEILQNVQSLNLPDCWIGAGFVRSKIWDHLHEYKVRTPIPDIDVIYFDSVNIGENTEKVYEKTLKGINPNVKWSVKNQAKMHTFHDDLPYKNSKEALARWVETATCIAVRLSDKNKIETIAPHGISDLVNLILRPTNSREHNLELFHQRVKSKHWLKI